MSILPILLLLLEISLLHIEHCILIVLIQVHCISIISICLEAIFTVFAFVTFFNARRVMLQKLTVVQVKLSICELVVLTEFNTLVSAHYWNARSHLLYYGRCL